MRFCKQNRALGLFGFSAVTTPMSCFPLESVLIVNLACLRGVAFIIILIECNLIVFLRAGVEVLFNELEIPEEEYSLGRSKIFIRNPRTVCQLTFYTLRAL